MFVELGLFKTEKEQYASKIVELNETISNEEDLKRKLDEAELKYKGQIRKFLPSALNAIKTVFGIDYSIYKVGKDFNSEFKVVETNVRKTKPEVFAEMNEFKLQAESMNLSEADINKLNLAMDVFITYSDDAEDGLDENKEDYMKHAKVTTSSIVNVPTRANNAFEPVTNKIQHNPYANQMADNTNNPYSEQLLASATGFKDENYDNKGLLVDPFASLYNGSAPVQEISSKPVESTNTNYQNNSIFSGQQQFIQSNNNQFIGQQIQEPISNNQFIGQNNISPIQKDVQFSVPSVNSNMDFGSNNKFVGTDNNIQMQNKPNNQNDNGWKIYGEKEEHPTLVIRIISGILIPVLCVIIAVITMKVSEISLIQDLMIKLLDRVGLNWYFTICYLIIGVLCLIFGTLIIALGKMRTRHLGKFLVLPSLLASTIIYFSPNIIEFVIENFNISIELSLTVAIYMALTIYIVMAFICLLFVRSLFRKKEKSDRIKWNIAEKIGFLILIYTIFIPLISMFIGLLGNDSILESISIIYNYNYSQYIMGGLSALVMIIIIIFNIKEDKRL